MRNLRKRNVTPNFWGFNFWFVWFLGCLQKKIPQKVKKIKQIYRNKGHCGSFRMLQKNEGNFSGNLFVRYKWNRYFFTWQPPFPWPPAHSICPLWTFLTIFIFSRHVLWYATGSIASCSTSAPVPPPIVFPQPEKNVYWNQTKQEPRVWVESLTKRWKF